MWGGNKTLFNKINTAQVWPICYQSFFGQTKLKQKRTIRVSERELQCLYEWDLLNNSTGIPRDQGVSKTNVMTSLV